MADIELAEWNRIVENPREEVSNLFRRKELYFADIHTDPLSWHMQASLWGILRVLDDVFSRWQFEEEHPSDHESSRWMALGARTEALGMLRAIREHADEMTVLLASRKTRDQMLQDQIAHRIRAELVCCDSAQKADGLHESDRVAYREFLRSPDYHPMCHYGEWAARLAEEKY